MIDKNEFFEFAKVFDLPIETVEFELFQNPRGNNAIQGKIGYIGPSRQGPGSIAKIKLDLTGDEIVSLAPAVREVYHPYSDKPEQGIHARCYAYEEVFAEKVRALAERCKRVVLRQSSGRP